MNYTLIQIAYQHFCGCLDKVAKVLTARGVDDRIISEIKKIKPD